MAPSTFDQRFAGVPTGQRQSLQRFWLDHPYTERLPDGTPWRYVAMGTGRRLLVLIPHALFPADAWFQLATALKDGYRLLIPDGYALQGVFDPVRITEALVQMIESEGGHSATLIAHSCGGSPAQWLLHRWPHRVQHLVLCHSPALGPDAPLPYQGSRTLLRTLLRLLPAVLADQRLVQGIAPNLPQDGPWLAFSRAYLGLHASGPGRQLLNRTLGAEKLMRLLFRPSELQQQWPGRLLMITAQNDPFSVGSVATYRERYPGAQFSSFDAGGHWTPLLYPDLVTARVTRFLRESDLTP